jgi:hypothetical protein
MWRKHPKGCHRRASLPSEVKRQSLCSSDNNLPFEDGSQPPPASSEHNCVQNRTRSERKRASPERFSCLFLAEIAIATFSSAPPRSQRYVARCEATSGPAQPFGPRHPAALTRPGTGTRKPRTRCWIADAGSALEQDVLAGLEVAPLSWTPLHLREESTCQERNRVRCCMLPKCRRTEEADELTVSGHVC